MTAVFTHVSAPVEGTPASGNLAIVRILSKLKVIWCIGFLECSSGEGSVVNFCCCGVVGQGLNCVSVLSFFFSFALYSAHSRVYRGNLGT